MSVRQLVGRELEGGWKATELIDPGSQATGGHFSVQYKVEKKDGTIAFMKVMNFDHIMHRPPSERSDAMAEALAEYHFERDTFSKCKNKRLSRVVVPLAHGSVNVPGSMVMGGDVYYIIFEYADKGDLRSSENKVNRQDIRWVLRSLHHLATGLAQLHSIKIAHQDIKPSNIFVFKESNSIDISKIGDLGRVSDGENPFKYDSFIHPGDSSYAPIDKFYGIKCDEFVDRFAVDMYLLGSMFFYFFFDVPLTQLIFIKMENINPNFTKSDFESDLPMIRYAFMEVVDELKEELEKINIELSGKIVELVVELCEPDPLRRGRKGQTSKYRQFEMNRYVGVLNNLAFRAETGRL